MPERNLSCSRTFTPSATMILRHPPRPASTAADSKTSSMSRVDGCVLIGEVVRTIVSRPGSSGGVDPTRALVASTVSSIAPPSSGEYFRDRVKL